jgi:hypothetical protein
LSDFDFSGNMSERTSGTTLDTYYQGATYRQAPGLDFANIENGGQPTNDDSTTTATDSESDSDLDLDFDLISYSDIACVLPKIFVWLFLQILTYDPFLFI